MVSRVAALRGLLLPEGLLRVADRPAQAVKAKVPEVIARPAGGLSRSQVLRLIALIKTEDLAKKILKAMHLPSDVPQLRPARPPRPPTGDTGRGDDWLN